MRAFKEIKDILKSKAGELRDRFSISKISVFGSIVRGEASAGSDIDILATFDSDISLLKLVSAENYLSEILNMKVDLIPEKNLRIELRERILKEAVPV
jgi:predicted nucleotidyltransferase